jgi:hypothetical protein
MVRIESMRIIADDLEPGERISVQSRSRESSGMQIVGYDRSQPAGSTARRIVTDVVAVCAVTFCANSCESPIILAVRKAPTITSTVDARIPAVRRNVHTTRQHSGAFESMPAHATASDGSPSAAVKQRGRDDHA